MLLNQFQALPNSPESIEIAVEHKVLSLLLNNALAAHWQNTIISGLIFIVVILSGQYGVEIPLAWFACVILLDMRGYLEAKSALRRKRTREVDARIFSDYIVGTILLAAGWVFAIVYVVPEANERLRYFMLVMVGGMVAGAVPTLLGQKLLIRMFAVTLITPMLVTLMMSGKDPIDYVLALSTVVYTAAILRSASLLNATLVGSIRLGIERKELLTVNVLAFEKLAEESQKNLNALSLVEATLEATDNGILVIGLNQQITLINQRCIALWNLSAPLLLHRDGKLILDCIQKQQRIPTEFIEKIQHKQGRPESSFRDTLQLVDGRVIILLSQPQRIGNEIVGRVWSFLDVTEQHRAEERVLKLTQSMVDIANEMAQQERSLRKAQTEFFSFVAHELRTPLAALKMGFKNISRSLTSAENAIQMRVNRMNRTANVMSHLIDRHLNFQRLNSADLSPAFEKELPQEPAEDAMEEIREQHPAREFLLTVDAGVPESLLMDHALIKMALGNLLSNAVKYSPADTPIELKLLFDSALHYCVIDQGPGIPPDGVERLFNLYHRDPLTDKQPGFGIGLAICKRIAELHSGTVLYAPGPVSGSTFTLSLPLNPGPGFRHE